MIYRLEVTSTKTLYEAKEFMRLPSRIIFTIPPIVSSLLMLLYISLSSFL